MKNSHSHLSQLLFVVYCAAGASSLRVIGAGFGRTGTESMQLALEILGQGPTYHMKELLGLGDRPASPLEILGLIPGHNERWVEVEKNVSLGIRPEWGFLEEHYKSAVDAPASSFWPELLEANPDAKVILTVRDPEAWHRSIKSSFCRVVGGGSLVDRFVTAITFLRPYGQRNKRMHEEAKDAGIRRTLGMPEYTTPKICDDQQYALKVFERWNAKVKEVVPAHQLLVFETGKHGWAELAPFLGVATPDTPYPRSNSSAEFAFIIVIFRTLAALTLLLPGGLLWLLWRRSKAGSAPRAKGD